MRADVSIDVMAKMRHYPDSIWEFRESHQDFSFNSASEIRTDVIIDSMFKTLGDVSPPR